MLLVGLAAASLPAVAQEIRAADCADLGRRFERLVGYYVEAGRKAIEAHGDIALALDKARQKALAGEATETITMTGILLASRSQAERFSVASVRQICTQAERIRHPLHIATCAYITALNPLGERAEKRLLVERSLKAFESLPDGARGAPHFSEDMAYLATCLPPD